MKNELEKVMQNRDMTVNEMNMLANSIIQGELSEVQIAAFLVALKMKGESSSELTGLAKALQRAAVTIPTQFTDAMDNCGTGGDRSFSFNISTTAAFVLAAGGVHMAKHGNRSITSKSGSADVLEALGINLYLSPEKLAAVFDKIGLVFLFAQNLHPAMKYFTPVRRQLEIPTIMNLTGPLINPVPLETQLLGTSRPDLLQTTAEVLKGLGRKRAIVITGQNNVDEATLFGVNHYALLENGDISLHEFTAADLGMEEVTLNDIRGGEAPENAKILENVLKNSASPYLETTVLNAGLGFYAAGKVSTIKEGISLARDVIANGAALEKLRALQKEQVGE
ncbi:anthranilate phosphoribosyltransferase [Lactococcus hircilactis]|uniref:Anthranilate phosphoribosyltransferase n=1 Tax=Lactococcus hircilactis TaxID=1494462 RepID=A0A7X1Z8S1_9LACT|nr:anthranilate phosphoribosyltransferase [Lactococcus hircilactis]MQW38881.1 anthranilate phosphoribosyltransferase [Lactococcus hircilactis]